VNRLETAAPDLLSRSYVADPAHRWWLGYELGYCDDVREQIHSSIRPVTA